MSRQFTASPAEIESKFRNVSSLVMDMLVPSFEVARICGEIGFQFRDRVYTPMVSVWLFLAQVLSADHSCQQAVMRLNAWRTARGLSRCSSQTAAYCKARGRLPEELFERLLDWTAKRCNEAAIGDWLFHGRKVDIVDGTTVTMADTPENQFAYPQMKSRNRGCGFPIARVVQVFSMATGAVTMMAMGPYAGKGTGEISLLRTLLDRRSANEPSFR